MKSKCLAIVAITIVIGLPLGCARKPADFDTLFSPVYREFDGKLLTGADSKAPDDVQNRGSWNTKTERGSRQMSGILPAGSADNPCADVLSRVESFIGERTKKVNTEGDLLREVRLDQKRVYGMWMYNCGNRHGEFHLWLFPNQTDGSVAFASYQYEENLK